MQHFETKSFKSCRKCLNSKCDYKVLDLEVQSLECASTKYKVIEFGVHNFLTSDLKDPE